jgi:isochorismate hydrolase
MGRFDQAGLILIDVQKAIDAPYHAMHGEEHLRTRQIDRLVITGMATNNSVQATVRMRGNLGFDDWLVADACFTFAPPVFVGRPRSDEEVHAMSLANLNGKFCTVIDTELFLMTGRTIPGCQRNANPEELFQYL